MKKELCALALLLSLISLSAWNVYNVNRLADKLLLGLERSETALFNGDTITAQKELDESLELWLNSDGYTHIFLRHSEIDTAADAFYELGQVLNESPEEAAAAFDKLRYHLESIASMENISLRSVL